ncbi:MAG: ThiF family adenylyltransferase [Bryobacterales bacterium]|nr:ThiF family adenylyltransferase [Bryobacterales bacterium]
MPPPDRYSRQERFPPIGPEGQRRIGASRAAIVGCGALGSYHAAALARAGVGYLRLIDRDYVEWNNLQRQWLYEEADAADATPKAVAARRALERVNSSITVEAEVSDLTPRNAFELLDEVDLILDGCDNFETRYLINDYAVQQRRPWIYGAAVSSYGLVMPVLPGETACLRCVYPSPPAGAQDTCETAGVLASITTTVAALQVSMALQWLSGHPEAIPRRITTLDLWSGDIRQTKQPGPQPECPACGLGQFEWLEGRHRAPVSLCGRNAVQIHERNRPLDLAELARRLSEVGEVRWNEFALRLFQPPFEVTVFPDGRAIVKGTTDVAAARSWYAKYIGA